MMVDQHRPKTLRFAFLLLEEHPWGRAMLRRLAAKGHIPALIIEEVSRGAEIEREKFLTRMAGQPVAPTIAQQVARLADSEKTAPPLPPAPQVYYVPGHNHPACRRALEQYHPDLVVLAGTQIIRPYLLEYPAPFVNAHPGLLPWLRGSASVGWALYLDQPIGATIHFIDPGIDTGDIILRRELPVTREDTYETLNYRVAELAANLMAEALGDFADGSVPREPQDRTAGQTYKVIPEDLLDEGKKRLAEGRYSHYTKLTRYHIRARLLCHDVRLNTTAETQVFLDRRPTEKEAEQYLWPVAEEIVAQNFCDSCPYELLGIDVQET